MSVHPAYPVSEQPAPSKGPEPSKGKPAPSATRPTSLNFWRAAGWACLGLVLPALVGGALGEAAAIHARNNVGSMVALFVFDHLLLRPWVEERTAKARDATTARWFFVHSFANLLVCATSLNSLVAVLRDPVHAMDGSVHTDASAFGTASVWPLTIINSVHVYHMIGGFSLSPADYFHHLLFIPALGFPGQIYPWGALGNFQAFFISGFPGGCDYFMLGLQKVGWLDHLVEKRANANLNTWVRTPGILCATVFCYQAILLGLFHAPTWAVILQLALPPYNAMYFGKQASANYAVHYMLHLLGQDDLIRERISQRTSVTTGTDILSWKDALGVPQRGS